MVVFQNAEGKGFVISAILDTALRAIPKLSVNYPVGIFFIYFCLAKHRKEKLYYLRHYEALTSENSLF